MSFLPLHSVVFDVVVFGAGYAGFAAALSSHRAGRRTLLVERHASLLAESSLAFATETGSATDPLWREWQQRLGLHRPVTARDHDGAIAEVLASDLLSSEKLPLLYFAAPFSAEPDASGMLGTVRLATKSGPLVLRARQWIDATDRGELAALLAPTWRAPTPAAQVLTLFFRHPRPLAQAATTWQAPDGLPLTWMPSGWANEHTLAIRLPGDTVRPREAWLPALRALHGALTSELKGAVLTHGSVVPWNLFPDCSSYSATSSAPHMLPQNVWFAGATGRTLAEKFLSGRRAFEMLPSLACGQGDSQAKSPRCNADVPAETHTDVAVAGLGTGGALAAISAARADAKVFAFDAMPFPGGIGTGGGIHVYYFGVKGGLQEEVDQRVREAMPLFGTPAQVGGFHPEAKKLVLDSMLAEAGVALCHEAHLHDVQTANGRVQQVSLATPGGARTVHARAWIDATGDGDVAARAGATFRLGRCGDGLLHAYGQSSGRARIEDATAKLQIINFDAGFCDPTDAHDFTRARLDAITHYVQARYDAESRPTYIAPHLGVRQSRHFETDYTVSLDDLINRRRFPDCVGYTGCHYDNHARDYEFETDEAAFWVWICQQWYGRLACEIPFRALLPRNLENVVLACRALGVSEEAHHSLRMQRDMQRIGEAAGVAAAVAVNGNVDFRRIALNELREHLTATGAIKLNDSSEEEFGRIAGPDYFAAGSETLAGWLRELREGPATVALWHLYRAQEAARPHVTPLLDSPDTTISWRAAALLAMWQDERAEPRLWRAIRTREDDRTRDITRPQQEWFYMARWYAALTLLKRCLTPRSLPVLEELSADVSLALNLRNAVALACAALAQRHALSPAEVARTSAVLDRLLAAPAPHSRRSPQSSPLGQTEPPSVEKPTDLRPVIEDYNWQLALAVARARKALGVPPPESLAAYLQDERSIVRRAFARLIYTPAAKPLAATNS